jgi:transposase
MKTIDFTKQYDLFAGIDVSNGKADAAVYMRPRDRNKNSKFIRKSIKFQFTQTGINEFLSTVRAIRKDGCLSILYAMEVTGVYSDNVYMFIREHLQEGETVKFLDTKFVDKWRDTHAYAKSDPLDAKTIAQMCATDDDVRYVEKFPDYKGNCNKKGHAHLNLLTHRYHQINKQLTAELNRLGAQCVKFFPELQSVFSIRSAAALAILEAYPSSHHITKASKAEVYKVAYEASRHHCSEAKIDELIELCRDTIVPADAPEEADLVIREMVDHIQSLLQTKRKYKKMMIQIASKQSAFEKLQTLIGIGDETAAIILGEVYDIALSKRADNFVSYCGLTPRNKKSGSSVDTHGKISKKGSSMLRHAIYMAAEYARRHNPYLANVFARVKNGNKKRHKLAVIAVANKMARYIYAILKNDSDFILLHEDLMKLPEDTRNTFFQSISTEIPEKTRKCIYKYSDVNGIVHNFIFTGTKSVE